MLAKLPFGRPSHATVVAYLALFVALGGTSAVALSGSNTVFSDDIANDNFNSPTEGQGGLVASDLRAGSVTSSEVANGTLQAQDYGIGSVSGARIQDNNVTTLDLADGAIFGNDIRDGSLKDEDVGERTFVNLTVNVGTVPAHDCVYRYVTGVGGFGDHVVLTPNWVDTHTDLEYMVQHSALNDQDQDSTAIEVCNPTGSAADDGTTRFNLLVINAG